MQPNAVFYSELTTSENNPQACERSHCAVSGNAGLPTALRWEFERVGGSGPLKHDCDDEVPGIETGKQCSVYCDAGYELQCAYTSARSKTSFLVGNGTQDPSGGIFENDPVEADNCHTLQCLALQYTARDAFLQQAERIDVDNLGTAESTVLNSLDQSNQLVIMRRRARFSPLDESGATVRHASLYDVHRGDPSTG